jgi:hypothetical protein
MAFQMSLLEGEDLILLPTFGVFKLINPATVLTASQAPGAALEVMTQNIWL